MKILIIGFGSIGKRHARIALEALKIEKENICEGINSLTY